jgi:hypothetical protein
VPGFDGRVTLSASGGTGEANSLHQGIYSSRTRPSPDSSISGSDLPAFSAARNRDASEPEQGISAVFGRRWDQGD